MIDQTHNLETLAARIQELRQARKLTQAELAARIGVSPNSVARYEAGSVVPTVAGLLSIADALGVHVGKLFSANGKKIIQDA